LPLCLKPPAFEGDGEEAALVPLAESVLDVPVDVAIPPTPPVELAPELEVALEPLEVDLELLDPLFAFDWKASKLLSAVGFIANTIPALWQ
jgi:hypothetical protein